MSDQVNPDDKVIEGGQDMSANVVFQVRQPRKKPLKNVGNIVFDENGQFRFIGSNQDLIYVTGLLEQHAVYPVGDARLNEMKGKVKEKAVEPVQSSAPKGDGKSKAPEAGNTGKGSGGKPVDGKGPAAPDGAAAGDGTQAPNGNGEGPVDGGQVKGEQSDASTSAPSGAAAVEGQPGADQTGGEDEDDPFAGI